MNGICKDCELYTACKDTDRTDSISEEGFGYCTNNSTFVSHDGWSTTAEQNPSKDAVINYGRIVGWMGESHKAQGRTALMTVGENFGCVHFKQKS